MTITSITPVEIAEQILWLTRTNFDSSNPQSDPLALYNAKIRMQDLCNGLLQTALGGLEYTVLLAGAYYSTGSHGWHSELLSTESCQESSALGFITGLGVPDIIADETATVADISKASGVDARFLSKFVGRLG